MDMRNFSKLPVRQRTTLLPMQKDTDISKLPVRQRTANSDSKTLLLSMLLYIFPYLPQIFILFYSPYFTRVSGLAKNLG